MLEDYLLQSVFLYRQIGATRTPADVTVDANQDYSAATVTHDSGTTQLRFTRARNTSDPVDEDLSDETDCHYIIVAWGGAVDYSTNTIGQHSFTNRAVTAQQICFPNGCDPGRYA